MGENVGFVAKVKAGGNEHSTFTHCMIHLVALVAKKISPELDVVFQDTIKIINFIKSRALNSRLFSNLWKHMDYKSLLLHAEIHSAWGPLKPRDLFSPYNLPHGASLVIVYLVCYSNTSPSRQGEKRLAPSSPLSPPTHSAAAAARAAAKAGGGAQSGREGVWSLGVVEWAERRTQESWLPAGRRFQLHPRCFQPAGEPIPAFERRLGLAGDGWTGCGGGIGGGKKSQRPSPTLSPPRVSFPLRPEVLRAAVWPVSRSTAPRRSRPVGPGRSAPGTASGGKRPPPPPLPPGPGEESRRFRRGRIRSPERRVRFQQGSPQVRH
ncbi:uncharacterized protein LOC114054423 [Vombatus ursinus]|uniref:uncharacterized protein LOC114054423 n=1 Tax=Vombatus ursinus TaxID=29139 RepID=UPI000FFCE349|nr:uncharacterized protein LOC114054423 [Vombatus ursinus]